MKISTTQPVILSQASTTEICSRHCFGTTVNLTQQTLWQSLCRTATGKVANRADIDTQVKDGVPDGESVQTGPKDSVSHCFIISNHVITQSTQTVTVTHFKSCVPRSRANIQQKLTNIIILLFDDAHPHVVHILMNQANAKLKYPIYSPELSQCNIHVSGSLKKALKGHILTLDGYVQVVELQQPKEFFVDRECRDTPN